MLWRFSRKFQFAADKFIPDSFVFCIILTLIVYALGLGITDAGPLEMIVHWYDGLWKMIAFAFQMSTDLGYRRVFDGGGDDVVAFVAI